MTKYKNKIFIDLFDKDPAKTDSLANATIYIIPYENHFYIGLVQSRRKGLGKELLYLITCLADKLNFKAVFFEAQPEATANMKPQNNNNNTRKQKGKKLLEYYNSLGFKRNGDYDYENNIGLTQKYKTNIKDIISRISGGHYTRRKNK